ncbi:MAG: hypothetical protein NC453_24170 [Muribaculum sp.]|nr:hypothetical protein [Muribaculum sp.]
MKQLFFSILLLLTMVLFSTSLTSCGGDEPDTPETPTNPSNPDSENDPFVDLYGYWLNTDKTGAMQISKYTASQCRVLYYAYDLSGKKLYDYESYYYGGKASFTTLVPATSGVYNLSVKISTSTATRIALVKNSGQGDDLSSYIFNRVNEDSFFDYLEGKNNSGSQSEISSNDFIGKWNHPSGAYVIDLQSAGICYLYILKSWKGDTYTEMVIGTWEYNLSSQKLTLTSFKGKIEETVSAANFPDDFTTNQGKWTKCNVLPVEESNEDASKLYGTWVGKDYGDTYTITFYSNGTAKEVWSDGEDTESISGKYSYSNGKITEWLKGKGSILENTLGECPWPVEFQSSTKMTLGSGYSKITFTKK